MMPAKKRGGSPARWQAKLTLSDCVHLALPQEWRVQAKTLLAEAELDGERTSFNTAALFGNSKHEGKVVDEAQ